MSIRKKIPVFLVVLSFLIFQFSCGTLKEAEKEPEKEIPKQEVVPEELPPKEEKKEETVKEEVEDKDPPKIRFAKALNSALLAGDYNKALALFDELDEELASKFEIRNLKLSVLISANKLKDAKSYASLLEKDFPNNSDVLYSQFMLAQAENNKQKQNSYLKKIIAKNPKDSRALTALGMDYYNKKNYTKARRNFIQAYKADKTCMEAILGLARINYMQNNLKQAERNLTTVLKHEPDNAIALAELARVKSETDRLFDAIQDINKAVEIDSKNPSHWLDLGAYNMQIGRKEEARTAYSNVIKLAPDYYIAYIYRAGLNDELGYKEEALNDYIKVCNLYPQYYFAWEGAGILFWEKQDWRNARYAFVNALMRSPSSYQYAILTALCDYKRGKKFESKKVMKEYLKTIDRAKKPNEYFLCRLFIDFAGDIDVLNRIAKEKDSTKQGRMYFFLAEFYNIKKKPELAVKCYEEVLSIQNPSFFEYRLAESTVRGDDEESVDKKSVEKKTANKETDKKENTKTEKKLKDE